VAYGSLRERVETRLEALRRERNPWLERWRDVRDLVLPYRGRLVDGGEGDRARNARRQDRAIINGTPGHDLKVLAAGMASGLTNPASAWFRLATQDPGVMESSGVRLWLEAAEQALYRVFAKSNWYQQLNVLYFQLGAYGTAAIFHDEDIEDVARFRTFSIGEYFLGNDNRGLAKVAYREFLMTVDNIVGTFVARAGGGMDWEAVSTTIKTMWDKGQTEEQIAVCHAVEPASPRLMEATDRPGGLGRWAYPSIYWLKSDDRINHILRAGGYEGCPVHAPRWDVELPDAYGIGPGIEGIGDFRQLQIGEKRLAQIIDRVSGNAALTGPVLAGGPVDLLGQTYIPVPMGTQGGGVRPLYEIPPAAVQLVQQENVRIEQRIHRTFYADLFLMLAEIERSGVTATEINERKEEKLVVLGPVVMRTTEELLDPAIDRVFSQLLRASAPRWKLEQAAPLPPPPPELAGAELKVEYVSLLQQAQQQRRADGIGRLVQSAAVLVQISPDVGDKINADEMMDELADSWGVSRKVLHGSDEVAQVRQARAQAAAQAQQAQAAQGAVEAANKLGGAKMEGTALGALLGQGGPQGPGGQAPPVPANAA
jgi:hypothetical protein